MINHTLGGLININKYVLTSDKLQVGEYCIKSELENFAQVNNLVLIYQSDRIIADAKQGIYFGKKGGDVYHTFSVVCDNIYQYKGTLLKDTELKKIDLEIPTRLIVRVKEEVRTFTDQYRIEINKTYQPDLSYYYFISVFTDRFEQYNYKFKSKELCDYDIYCNVIRNHKNTNNISLLNQMKDEILKKLESVDHDDFLQLFKYAEINRFINDYISKLEKDEENYPF